MTSSNDLTILIAELARAQARTEASIQLTQENQRRTDTTIREAQVKTEASLQETQLDIRETHHQLLDLKGTVENVLAHSEFVGGRQQETLDRHEQILILNQESIALQQQLLISQQQNFERHQQNFDEHQRESREIQRSIEAGLARLETILMRRLDGQ